MIFMFRSVLLRGIIFYLVVGFMSSTVWAKKSKLNVLDELGQLELYSDVVVIQKKTF